MLQKPISTRLRRFTLALNHAKKIENRPKVSHLASLIMKEKGEIALFMKGENE